MHNQQSIRLAAYATYAKTFQFLHTGLRFEQWLEQAKLAGKYWGA